jgi:tetratricopeptide (TPR) repeat protein
MRLRRAAAAIRNDPDDFAAYDDAGVSCDRLRRGDEAIAWMEKKRARLATKDRGDAAVREHWYRYHANVGTFWAHRWLRAGADRARMGEMKRARAHIAAAIAINPDAHFGREKYQLAVMDWIIAGGGPKRQSLNDYLLWPDPPRPAALGTTDEAVRGLSGLIVVGDAWESLDVFAALANALGRKGDASLSAMARLRGAELIDAGRRSLLPGASTEPEPLKRELRLDARAWYGLMENNRTHVGRVYRTARRAAETWQAQRTAYLVERLRAGRHPDTDPAFWQDWREPAPARLTGSWLWERASLLRTPSGHLII